MRRPACAYLEGEAVAWSALAPREAFGRLVRSPLLRQLDDTPVWSLPCFYVARRHRRSGLTLALIDAAADYVRAKGGTTLEGYPVEPRTTPMPAAFAYHGLASTFRRAGFEEVARPSATRRIMRRRLADGFESGDTSAWASTTP